MLGFYEPASLSLHKAIKRQLRYGWNIYFR
jgi:hypothetical protein